MHMAKHGAALAFLLLGLCGCTTIVQTNPPRTAMEEMLISTATDRAAAKLAPDIPAGAKVFVDNTNFEGTDSKYAIASIRSHLLARGLHLVDDKKAADVIIETRAGALSTDRKSFMIGIPSFNVPIPLASSPLPFPEIALYGSDEQKGVAKFAITGYDTKKGTLVTLVEPQYGFSHSTKKTVLVFISWTDSDYIPEDAEKEKIQKSDDPDKSAAPHMEVNGNGYSAAPATPATSTPPPATSGFSSFFR